MISSVVSSFGTFATGWLSTRDPGNNLVHERMPLVMTDHPVDLVTVRCLDCGPSLIRSDEIVFLRINVETGVATMHFPCAACGLRDA